MGRWDRLSDISNNTHQYLNKIEVQKLLQDAGARIGKIELTKRRLERQDIRAARGDHVDKSLPTPPSYPEAVELPGEDAPSAGHSPMSQYATPRTATSNLPYPYYDKQPISGQDKFIALPPDDRSQHRVSAEIPYRRSGEYKSDSPFDVSPRRSGEDFDRPDAPPIPPKTPINDDGGLRPPFASRPSPNKPVLPYPDFDGPPPMVNKLRKPHFNPG